MKQANETMRDRISGMLQSYAEAGDSRSIGKLTRLLQSGTCYLSYENEADCDLADSLNALGVVCYEDETGCLYEIEGGAE
jgi:hypothetical protein